MTKQYTVADKMRDDAKIGYVNDVEYETISEAQERAEMLIKMYGYERLPYRPNYIADR